MAQLVAGSPASAADPLARGGDAPSPEDDSERISGAAMPEAPAVGAASGFEGDCAESSLGASGARREKNMSMAMSATPTQMAMSATLKVGQ